MEDKQLNEKESLELIGRMIRNTCNRVEKNSGRPFLIWGYATFSVAVGVWLLVSLTSNGMWYWLWFLLPVVAWPLSLGYRRRSEEWVITYVDRIIRDIWIVFGVAGALIPLMSMFYRLPVLFLIALLMGMGGALTGLVIRYKLVYLSGFVGMALSVLCFFFQGVNSLLIFAFPNYGWL